MATDDFANNCALATTPARNALSVTPTDNDQNRVSKALYIGGAGDIAIRMVEGADVTFVGVPAGTVLPIQALQIKATGTTATSIIALY